MNTSNSSRQRKGQSMASHIAITNAMVERLFSPPESEFGSVADVARSVCTCTTSFLLTWSNVSSPLKSRFSRMEPKKY